MGKIWTRRTRKTPLPQKPAWDLAVDVVFQLQLVWGGIHGRCNSPRARGYALYGALGKGLCEEWSTRQGSRRFIKWAIQNGWRPGLVIDRIDNALGYSPKNCRCVTPQQNSWNKSNNKMLTFEGETKCAAEWGSDRRCQVPTQQFQQRIQCGWSVQRALETPLRGWGPGRIKDG